MRRIRGFALGTYDAKGADAARATPNAAWMSRASSVDALRSGAIVATDNTAKRRQAYGALLAYLGDPASGFITQTLPFDGGFEISVKLTGN